MASKNALKNLKELNNAYKKLMKLSGPDIGKTIEKVSYRLFTSLQLGTPRDTGMAINGWIPTLNSGSNYKPIKGLGNYGPRPFDLTGRIKPYSKVYIQNNVEYIEALDEGHSQQAPYGFTNAALREATMFSESETRRLNKKRYNV